MIPIGRPVRDASERPLARMRGYTNLTLGITLGMLTGVVVFEVTGLPSQIAGVVVGATVLALAMFWERRLPLWLSLAAVLGSGAFWCFELAGQGSPVVAFLFAVALTVPITHARTNRSWWALAGLGIMVGPVAAAVVIAPNGDWGLWFSVAAASYLAVQLIFWLNAYSWGLYLEIDELRRSSAELAVAQERYRFAADLHDIQGHTLHVIRLKTRLAARLIERDPVAARVHLDEADALIGETLANTRSLAFGDREVALASELANAGALLQAADIEWTVTGDLGQSDHDELFGLVMRETTTNTLRHSQATEVTVTLAPGRLTIVNNGSPDSMRPLSGLARLAERIEAAGGVLRTSIDDGIFTTEASIP